MTERNEKTTRRGFLGIAMRAAGAAALTAMTAVLVRRNLAGAAGGSPAGSDPCENRFICGSCNRLESCGLPQALSARQRRRET